MKDDRKKIKEPYEPGDTPKPPQIIDPNKKTETPPEDNRERKGPSDDKRQDSTKKPHLLADEADIDDETTI